MSSKTLSQGLDLRPRKRVAKKRDTKNAAKSVRAEGGVKLHPPNSSSPVGGAMSAFKSSLAAKSR